MEENKDIIVETDEIQANSSNPEPLARSVYTMKAFQSSYQPATLAWDSVGDKANYNTNGAVTSEKWVRQGIYICSSDQFGGPGFFITDYDGFYDLPTYGNTFFKAVICRLDLKVMVPPYSNFTAVVDVERTIFKEGDSDSSTWLGMASGEWNACNTISKDNCGANGEWAGVPIESGFNSYSGKARHIDETRQCVYKTWNIDNRFSEKVVRTSMTPKYLMNMLERPKSYATRMGYVDKYHYPSKEFSTYFTAYVWYGGDFDAGNYYENKATRIVLRTSERTGYIMKGWLDAGINVLYPAGGAYRQRRGAKLQEQWMEDVVPYKVVHHYTQNDGTTSKKVETLYYMADKTVCPLPDQDFRYVTPEPITTKVAADGSTEIDYNYTIKKFLVQYCANGGHFSNGKDILKQEVRFGMQVDRLEEKPNRTGYLFSEWDPYPLDVDSSYSIVTRAKWTANKYTVKYDKNDDNATEEMESQGFVYDQPQQLSRNEYKCRYTVSFAVGDRRGDNAYFQPQTAECHFMGWAETATGAKAYDDGATVCNLTSERDGVKTLYAVWKSASILLPQFYHEGYYFDAWYLDEDFKEESKAGDPGCEYFPTGDITLYGRLICTKAKNLRWEPGDEPVEERTIKAAWDPIDEATAYFVQLMDVSGDEEHSLPIKKEDLQEGDILIDEKENVIETTNPFVSLTATLAQYTSGGKYSFTVQPEIEGIETFSNESGEIITLARPEKPGWKDDVIAVWKSVQGAECYILQFFGSDGDYASNECGLNFINVKENMKVINEDESKLMVFADGAEEQNLDVDSLADGLFGTVYYTLKAYSENAYTPLYEPPAESDCNT